MDVLFKIQHILHRKAFMHPIFKKYTWNFNPLMMGFALLCFSQTAIGQTQKPAPQWLYDRALASTCVQCHSNVQHHSNQPKIPSLIGYDKTMLIEQMQAFKNGTRPATIMHQIAKGYSDAEIERIAEVLSTGLWEHAKPTAVHPTQKPTQP